MISKLCVEERWKVEIFAERGSRDRYVLGRKQKSDIDRCRSLCYSQQSINSPTFSSPRAIPVNSGLEHLNGLLIGADGAIAYKEGKISEDLLSRPPLAASRSLIYELISDMGISVTTDNSIGISISWRI